MNYVTSLHFFDIKIVNFSFIFVILPCKMDFVNILGGSEHGF